MPLSSGKENGDGNDELAFPDSNCSKSVVGASSSFPIEDLYEIFVFSS
jgi:hypothetical protein